MTKYIDVIIKRFQILITGGAATPAAAHLFEIDEKCEELLEQMGGQIHIAVAQLLYLSKQARPDIFVAVAFLTTRVKNPCEDDWKKLIRVLKYLKATKEIILTITPNNLNLMK
mmetsp:Transcript_35469/g.82305  ORF Transcript_35469/g.82305 Transcript_35469/m.82305 type:complete len:113 (+) Transcript_35469:4961-5299(+)